jgi:hypothetical protein
MHSLENDLVGLLNLQPHPEGGAFREIWRSPVVLPHGQTGEPRAASTAIYFLLRGEEFSALHEVCSDEIWILLDGGPLELHQVSPNGDHVARILHRGSPGHAPDPVHVIPAGYLQAARPCIGIPHALCCCIVAPGFDFADFRMPSRDELLQRHPALAGLMVTLSRD